MQAYAIMPQTFVDVVELLIPELQRRGIFWNDFHVPGGTYRENLYEMAGQHEPLPDHPAAAMIWRAPKDEHLLNGMNGSVNGYANGHSGDKKDDEEVVDPMSMQLD